VKYYLPVHSLSGISVSIQRCVKLCRSGEFSCATPMLVLVFVVTFLPDFLLFTLSQDRQKIYARRLLFLLSSVLFLSTWVFQHTWHNNLALTYPSPFLSHSLCRFKEADNKYDPVLYVKTTGLNWTWGPCSYKMVFIGSRNLT
jgi:hypothetical protein